MALFEKGHPKMGGRVKGTRNKIADQFLKDLLEEWNVGGRDAMKIARVNDPVRFCVMVANQLPKELEIAVGPLNEISDQELELFIEHVRERIAGSLSAGTDDREDKTLN